METARPAKGDEPDVSARLQVSNLDAHYGLIQALHDISLEVKAGEIVAVIGANGAGKTTLLRAISGLVPPSEGDIRFAGKRIAGLPPEQIVRLGIGHVPERRELFGSMSVLENLELGAYHRRGREAKNEVTRDLENIWEIFPILRARQTQTAGTLSGGEQQMLAIARGLMAQPRLLLLDEPSLGLAPLLVQEVLRIVTLLREMDRTVLLVEQNASGALQVADRAYLLEVGRIVLHGVAQDLVQDERVRRAYFGQRIAPPRRPHKIKPPPRSREPREKRAIKARPTTDQIVKTEEIPTMKMLSETLPSFTLPEEYFERRLSYTPEELEEIQDEALPKAVEYAFENSSFYRAKFSDAGLTPDSIRGLDDLNRLPFTSSREIRPSTAHAVDSAELMAVGKQDVSLVHTSSGTTGSPKIFAYTGQDITRWAANTATVFWINGFRKSDTVLGVMPFGEFTGGGGLYLGMLALGVTYLPMSLGPGVTDKVMAHLLGRVKINDHEVPIDPLLRANAMLCLGSFIARLEEMLDEYDVRPGELSLAKISAGAEPSSEAVRTRFAERFGIWPRDNYGLGEFYGPGVAGECETGGGIHVLSDAFIAEVVDPETGEPAPAGEMGELVLTSLHKEAVPLFRYLTGDRVMSLPQNCPCGSGHTWIGRVPGRISTDDIVIPGGVVVNRTYLEDILLQMDGAGTQYALTVAEHPSRKGLQRLYIAIEGDADPKLAETICHRVRVEYNHSPIVTILPPGTITRGAGKARRILTPDEYAALVEPFTAYET
jgi:ABC-type branched-subunit amino acid transport system ATPase component/phenylacetate-coenzyme A ligase PaaK-like adenylate-forming protein